MHFEWTEKRMTLKLACMYWSQTWVHWHESVPWATHSFPCVHCRAKVRRDVLMKASHLQFSPQREEQLLKDTLQHSHPLILCCLISSTSPKYSIPFTSFLLFPFVHFCPHPSLSFFRTFFFFFSGSLFCPFMCFSLCRVFPASWLSQSTARLPPWFTALGMEAARNSSCCPESKQNRVKWSWWAEWMHQSGMFGFSLPPHKALFVEETRRRFNPQGD